MYPRYAYTPASTCTALVQLQSCIQRVRDKVTCAASSGSAWRNSRDFSASVEKPLIQKRKEALCGAADSRADWTTRPGHRRYSKSTCTNTTVLQYSCGWLETLASIAAKYKYMGLVWCIERGQEYGVHRSADRMYLSDKDVLDATLNLR